MVQGGDWVAIFWNDPRYDGGTELLAYSVYWTPNSPPFPIFSSPRDESTRVYGLNSGTRYVARVKAYNRIDDSTSGFGRAEWTHNLIRRRPSQTFYGSIANGHATALSNHEELPGFELRADAGSLFWGDHVIMEMSESPRSDAEARLGNRPHLELASTAFAIKPNFGSRRSRFDYQAMIYEFVAPLKICVALGEEHDFNSGTYSIVQFRRGKNPDVFDSTPTMLDGAAAVCAPIFRIDTRHHTRFAVVKSEHPPVFYHVNVAPDRYVELRNAAVLLMLIFGPGLTLFGVRAMVANGRAGPIRGRRRAKPP